MSTWQEILSRVDGAKYADALPRIKEFILSNDLAAVHQKAAINDVAEVIGLWKVREKTSPLAGLSIPGLRVLVRNLKALPADSEIEQFGFVGDKLAGSLFFDRKTGVFLGDTIVERHPRIQEMLDLEAQMLQPSRKSA